VIKGNIFDIKRFAVHDGPGIRTTIFLKGCPLSCWWCHNPESRDCAPQRSVKHISVGDKIFEKQEVTGYKASIDEIVSEVRRDQIFYEESGGGITLSGGEPLHQPTFCTNLLRALKENEFHTSLDTTGYAPEDVIRQVMPYTDLFLYDLKLMDEGAHMKYTGVSNKGILENLILLLGSGKQVIIRVPVIPGITGTTENIKLMIDFLKSFSRQEVRKSGSWEFDCEVHLLPYHNSAKNKYQRFRVENKMDPGSLLQHEDLLRIKSGFENAGFRVKVD